MRYKYKLDAVISKKDPSKLIVGPEDLAKRMLWRHVGEEVTVEITVGKQKRKRTIDQNSFLFGILYPQIIDFHVSTQGTKPTKWNIHLFCMTHEDICGMEIKPVEVFGKVLLDVQRTKSSTKSVKAFSEKIVNPILRYFAERGLEWDLPLTGTEHMLTEYQLKKLIP